MQTLQSTQVNSLPLLLSGSAGVCGAVPRPVRVGGTRPAALLAQDLLQGGPGPGPEG